jgi:hypothetical protein
MSTGIEEIKVSEFKNQLENYQVLSERISQGLRTGHVVDGLSAANRVQGLSARIDKAARNFISPGAYAQSEKIKELLAKRAEYVKSFSKALKSDLAKEAETFSQWINEIDADLAKICI